MDTEHGLRGAIVPGERFKTGEDAFSFEGFDIEIKDGVIAIGFNNPVDADRARCIVQEHPGVVLLETRHPFHGGSQPDMGTKVQ
jgi:hypothetical protein